jgi:hypothetical protein
MIVGVLYLYKLAADVAASTDSKGGEAFGRKFRETN